MNNKAFKFTIDAMLLVLLLAIIIFPITTVGWFVVKRQAANDQRNVLPAATQNTEIAQPTPAPTISSDEEELMNLRLQKTFEYGEQLNQKEAQQATDTTPGMEPGTLSGE